MNMEKKDDVYNVDDEEEGEDLENSKEFVKMELQSTVAFRQIDIDKMLDHTTLDDFLKGLYISAISDNIPGKMSHQEKLMNMLMGGEDKDEVVVQKTKGPELLFKDQPSEVDMFRSDNLR